MQSCQTVADCPPGFFCNPKKLCQASLGCTTNADCTAPLTCSVETGQCLCSKDQDCAAGQLCSATGHCQTPAACFYDTDCASGFICDTASHACIPQGSCLQDVQCALGQICKPSADGGGACVPGCGGDGDCPLVAIHGAGQVSYTPQACVNGQCVAGACHETFECPFGDACQNGFCASSCSSQAPFCQGCDPTSSDPNQCGGPANFCLVDPRDDSSCSAPPSSCLYFCGVDCSSSPCPAGYACIQLLAVASAGQGPDEACNCGTTCSDGTACPCQEGATVSVCPCHSTGDCPVNSCQGGFCYVTGGPCNTDADCTQVACQQGSCVEAMNCAPVKEYSCPAGSGPCQGG